MFIDVCTDILVAVSVSDVEIIEVMVIVLEFVMPESCGVDVLIGVVGDILSGVLAGVIICVTHGISIDVLTTVNVNVW